MLVDFKMSPGAKWFNNLNMFTNSIRWDFEEKTKNKKTEQLKTELKGEKGKRENTEMIKLANIDNE